MAGLASPLTGIQPNGVGMQDMVTNQTAGNTATPTASNTGTPYQPSASQVAATAPLGLQSFGALGQVTPTYVNPANAQNYYTQYANMLQQSMQPTFNQQDQALQAQIMGSGLQNSGAAPQLLNNLYGQQSSTLAGQDAPFLSQAFGYQQNADTANAAYGNQASLYNAGAYNTALGGNQSTYNNYLNTLLGLGSGQSSGLLSQYLGTYEPSSEALGAFGSTATGAQNVYGDVYSNAATNQANVLSSLGQTAGDTAVTAAEFGLL